MSISFIPPISPRPPVLEKINTNPPLAALQLTLPANNSKIDDKLIFEIQRMAHESLSPACFELNDRIKERFVACGCVILLDRSLRDGMDLYAATFDQLDQLSASFESIRKAAQEILDSLKKVPIVVTNEDDVVDAQDVGNAAPIPFSPIQSALDLLGVVAQESQFFGRSVNISDEALLFGLSEALRSNANLSVFHPALFAPLQTTETTTSARTKLRASFDQAFAAKSAAFSAVSRLQAESAKLKPADPKFQELHFATERAVSAYDNNDLLLRELNSRLGTKDVATGVTGYQALMRAASVQDIFNRFGDKCFLLHTRVEAAGGSYRILNGLLRLISGEDGVEYSAGVVLSFGLFKLDGTLVSSGIVTKQSEFRSVAPVDSRQIFWAVAILLSIAFLLPELVRTLAKR